MAELLVPKSSRVQEDLKDVSFGICVWELEQGHYIMNEEGDYFCAQGKLGDKRIEQRMREAVVTNFGITAGRPCWAPGRRKISENEWADQMELLIEGHNPDPVDLYRQLEGK